MILFAAVLDDSRRRLLIKFQDVQRITVNNVNYYSLRGRWYMYGWTYTKIINHKTVRGVYCHEEQPHRRESMCIFHFSYRYASCTETPTVVVLIPFSGSKK